MKKLTPTMRAVLMAMDRGAVLRGSSLGDARLVDGQFANSVRQATHAALIRRGLVSRIKTLPRQPRLRDTPWLLTLDGLAELARIKKEASR